MNDRARYYAGFNAKVEQVVEQAVLQLVNAAVLRKLATDANIAKEQAANAQVNAVFAKMKEEANKGIFYFRTKESECNDIARQIFANHGYQIDIERNEIVISWE